MNTLLFPLLTTLGGVFRSRACLHLEILSLHQQLAMVNQSPRRRLPFSVAGADSWIGLYRIWPGCVDTVAIFKPDTLMRWHRQGFRLYWAWKSRRRRGGRPSIAPEIRELIRTMSRENGWGAPRIHGELQMLGINVSQAKVTKYMLRPRKPRSQTWRTFLDNHVKDLASVDFFIVASATFRILYVLVVLKHERRQVVHFHVTEHPPMRGPNSKSSGRFPSTRHPAICCAIATRNMGHATAHEYIALELGGLHHEYHRRAA